MKWQNYRRRNSDGSNQDAQDRTRDDCDDIRRSIEALDKVIDEFDADRIPNTTKNRKNCNDVGLDTCKVLQLDLDNLNDPVRQSLDILDTVLAQFEDESESNTKEIVLSEETKSIPNILNGSNPKETLSSNDECEDDEESMPKSSEDENLASPHSQFRKISPPPVPKRSPTTCLSCSGSSTFDCPSPEINSDLNQLEFPLKTSKDDLTQTEVDSKESKSDLPLPKEKTTKIVRNRARLSSKPVLKGSRPQLKSNDANSSTAIFTTSSQDDISENEDEVFHSLEPQTDLINIKSELPNREELQNNNKIVPPCLPINNSPAELTNNMNMNKEKFKLIIELIRTGQLLGLDEKPPSFKPPPPPKLSSLTKKNAGKINNSQNQPIHDSNGNNILTPNATINTTTETAAVNNNRTEFFKNSQQHVTSVKITPSSVQNSNISVITIQPKTPPILPEKTGLRKENSSEQKRATPETFCVTSESMKVTKDTHKGITESIKGKVDSLIAATESKITSDANKSGPESLRVTPDSPRATPKSPRATPKSPRVTPESHRSVPEPPRQTDPIPQIHRPALSTFTQRQLGSSATSSKSSSLEDMVSSNSRFQNTEIAAPPSATPLSSQQPVIQTGSLPLELKKQSSATGAVFFNIYQCSSDGEKTSDKMKETTVTGGDDAKKTTVATGWKHKKSKKKKNKEKEATETETTKIISPGQTALLAELTGKIQTKKAATPNGSSSDESEDGATNDQTAQSGSTNAKDEKLPEKKPWKGLFKKKQIPNKNETEK